MFKSLKGRTDDILKANPNNLYGHILFKNRTQSHDESVPTPSEPPPEREPIYVFKVPQPPAPRPVRSFVSTPGLEFEIQQLYTHLLFFQLQNATAPLQARFAPHNEIQPAREYSMGQPSQAEPVSSLALKGWVVRSP